jgi:plastocyanin
MATFVPATLDIKAGDTVIFENDDRNFHNVVFRGSLPEPPPGYDVYVDPETGGINVALAKESARIVDPPPEGFDDRTFLSSGSMGTLMPRARWQLRFDNPGRYLFNCTLHAFAGMAGVIEVSPR